MSEQPATLSYVIAEPFPQALKSLREALVAQGLEVTNLLNISERIRQKLLVGSAPCVILLVSLPAESGGALASDSCAAGLTPMHVALSSRGSQSEIHVLGTLPPGAALLGSDAMAALHRLQATILQAIEKIGMRITLVA
jgi:uncharacterized protein (DUF302 family)